MNLKLFFSELKKEGFNTVIGVPCSMLDGIIQFCNNSNDFKYIMATHEGEAVAIAAGINMAGQNAIVLSQNSGLGNMVNPISSLVYPYKIPILIIMSWRGEPHTGDEPQHELMGGTIKEILDLLKISYCEFPETENQINIAVKNILHSFSKGISYCLIVKKKIPSGILKEKTHFPTQRSFNNNVIDITEGCLISRSQALFKLINLFDSNAAFISSTGKCSRELFTLKDSDQNFYMVGSMGYASAIGFGISLKSRKKIVIIDGDGSILMRMGNIATIGHYQPENFYHILLNNNSYDSTGGQSTTSESVDFAKVALSCGYKMAYLADKNFDAFFETTTSVKGPHFIQINILSGSLSALARPNMGLQSLSKRFSKFLQNDLESVKNAG